MNCHWQLGEMTRLKRGIFVFILFFFVSFCSLCCLFARISRWARNCSLKIDRSVYVSKRNTYTFYMNWNALKVSVNWKTVIDEVKNDTQNFRKKITFFVHGMICKIRCSKRKKIFTCHLKIIGVGTKWIWLEFVISKTFSILSSWKLNVVRFSAESLSRGHHLKYYRF